MSGHFQSIHKYTVKNFVLGEFLFWCLDAKTGPCENFNIMVSTFLFLEHFQISKAFSELSQVMW